ncbi:hypothetical protein HPO96_35260 [Kribbella sandramycini]|uniref:Putative metalloprotease n=1 Tax=Kribbella sandramycini TaxID=60450 RepID=A0A7Y4L6Z3_9ACTN|nr:neutral zinc metallopeptidase [Kribbella sandramycini]MBB6566733.1 putative metalloprotease [Kribbella sandramycini]NOL45519.1 hypothetical protein [Kribbella sandramycini]
MPEETPDDGVSTPPAGGTPTPSGETPAVSEGGAARPDASRRQQPLELGKARALSDPGESALRRSARPLPADPEATSDYSGPPPAPLTGAPLPPLTGGRRPGGSRPVGWHSPSSRTGAQFASDGPPAPPPRQYSKAVIAGLSALTLIATAAVGTAVYKAISTYDSDVDSPLSRPSVHKSPAPIPTLPDPTVTVTVPGVPDAVRLQKNELYKAGKLAAANCTEPTVKPNSQSNILKYYKGLLPCLDAAWQPLIEKAGYKFTSPKLQLQSKKPTGTGAAECAGEENVAFYCSVDDSINISWKNDLERYQEAPLEARTWMMSTMAHEYGHHVQEMTEMLTAVWSRQGWAKTEVEELEWSRRRELQASCFGAVFLGSNKSTLGLTGNRLRIWEYQTKNSGDEFNPKKIRDHGSKKNQWYWEGPAFKSANPASCNTFTAPAARVS